MRNLDAAGTLFPVSNVAAAASAVTGADRSRRQMLEHRSSDLARAMAEQRESASADHEGHEERQEDGGGSTIEEVDDGNDGDCDAGSLSDGVCEGSGGEEDDENDGDDAGEKDPLPLNSYNNEDYSKMDIEEVRLRLAELENAGGPTKEEIDAMLAQYSDYSGDGSDSCSDDDGASDSSSEGNEHQETVIMKVLIVGNARCGKTSTIRQFVSKEFSENYVSTIGADFVEKLIEYDEQLKISLQLWDIAGQDRFAKLTRAYFREAKGALIVCDITRENTIDAVETWKNEIDMCARDLNGGESIPVVMVANKSDLLDDIVGALNIGVNMQKCVARNGIIEWFRASAKSGDSVDEAFQCLIDGMVAEHRVAIEKKNASLRPAGNPDAAAGVGAGKVLSEESNAPVTQRRRNDEIIRLTSLPPLSYDNTGGFGCDCN